MISVSDLLIVAFVNGVGYFFSQEFSKIVHGKLIKKTYEKLKERFE